MKVWAINMNQTLELLLNRRSNPKLMEPAPTAAELEMLLTTCLRAPDHAGLKPWHYVVIQGEGRNKLGQIMRDALAKTDPEADATKLEAIAKKPLRAPVVIAAICKYQEHPKVPWVEQVASVSAGVENLLVAAQSIGYAGYWRTGAMARDAHVKHCFGLTEQDEIVGFVYLGTPQMVLPEKSPPSLDDFVEYWN